MPELEPTTVCAGASVRANVCSLVYIGSSIGVDPSAAAHSAVFQSRCYFDGPDAKSSNGPFSETASVPLQQQATSRATEFTPTCVKLQKMMVRRTSAAMRSTYLGPTVAKLSAHACTHTKPGLKPA